MGLIDNIKNCISESDMPTIPPFRAVLFGNNAVYFENIKSIIGFSPEQIILSVKTGEVKLSGEGLYIKKYCEGDVVICGKICSIENLLNK